MIGRGCEHLRFMRVQLARSTWFPVALVALVALIASALALYVLPPTLVDDSLKGYAFRSPAGMGGFAA
jgi:hypothetical protein